MIIVAVIYLRTPTLVQEVKAFVSDFHLEKVFENFWWYVPSTGHPGLYVAAEQFCYAFGVVQIAILGLKFVKGSSTHGKAETFSSIVFWLGAGYLLGLLSQGALLWVPFIAGLVVLVGISIVARALVLILAPKP